MPTSVVVLKTERLDGLELQMSTVSRITGWADVWHGSGEDLVVQRPVRRRMWTVVDDRGAMLKL